ANCRWHSLNCRWVAGCVQCTEGFKGSRRTIWLRASSKSEPPVSRRCQPMRLGITLSSVSKPLDHRQTVGRVPGIAGCIYDVLTSHYFTLATHRRFTNLHQHFADDSPMSLEG
ncbi:hypothetical protein HAX54_032360, partial [Datura stramonium]|nr:hypothetical protein [Datura stramonium]